MGGVEDDPALGRLVAGGRHALDVVRDLAQLRLVAAQRGQRPTERRVRPGVGAQQLSQAAQHAVAGPHLPVEARRGQQTQLRVVGQQQGLGARPRLRRQLSRSSRHSGRVHQVPGAHATLRRAASASMASLTAPHSGESSPSAAFTTSISTSGFACCLAAAASSSQNATPALITPPPITKRRGLTRLAALPSEMPMARAPMASAWRATGSPSAAASPRWTAVTGPEPATSRSIDPAPGSAASALDAAAAIAGPLAIASMQALSLQQQAGPWVSAFA